MSDPQDEVCAHCGADIDGEEVVWIKPDGDVAWSKDEGADPYHEACVP